MRQILQNLRTGQTELSDVPRPQLSAGQVLIRTRATAVSVGTERMLVEFGKASLLDKARKQPEKVRQVIEKISTDGLEATLKAVQAKLDQPLALGYCNAGVVVETGSGVDGFLPGDRVVSNGPHAEFVVVGKNLCAKIPDDGRHISDEEACFTPLAAIALQGIRLAQPSLGERFVVTGLGLIGLLTVQLLRAHGCRVLGLDFDPSKLALARRFGAETVNLSQGEDPVTAAAAFSSGQGVDGVLVTASTKSSEPLHQAALMCRKRGRIVLVGVTGLELSRADFYEKELSFQVSCSYGPGRYDPTYESKGLDYPIGFVRWTEGRNFVAVLDAMAEGRLSLDSLISHRYDIDQAIEAYQELTTGPGALGVVLNYPDSSDGADTGAGKRTVALPASAVHAAKGASNPRVAVIGAGNYTTQVLLPGLRATGAQLRLIASHSGVTGFHAGRKYGFMEATTDVDELLAHPGVDTVVITTRHDSHAEFARRALEAGKHVFVEKPLALNESQLESVLAAARGSQRLLAVGFNRRYAPHVQRMKALLGGVPGAKTLIMTVNAGHIPPDHWTQDPGLGGGRIIGEACHFIDLLRYLVGCPITEVTSTYLGGDMSAVEREDKASITLKFADGSHGTIHYFANGHKSFPKERLEVFASGRILALDNFRVLRGYGFPGFRAMKTWRQDKGHAACIAAFIDAVKTGDASLTPLDELAEVTRASFRASLATH